MYQFIYVDYSKNKDKLPKNTLYNIYNALMSNKYPYEDLYFNSFEDSSSLAKYIYVAVCSLTQEELDNFILEDFYKFQNEFYYYLEDLGNNDFCSLVQDSKKKEKWLIAFSFNHKLYEVSKEKVNYIFAFTVFLKIAQILMERKNG